jgi:hypothetical protein
MLKGIDNKEVIEFASSFDQGDSKTVFLIGNMTNREKLRIFGQMASADGAIKFDRIDEKALEVLKVSIKGVKNLNGKDYDGFPEDVCDALPFNVLIELVGKVFESNFSMEASAEKN